MPERFSHLFEHLPEALLVLGDDGLIANANAAAAELYGCELHELLGQRLIALWDEAEHKTLLGRLADVSERGDVTLNGIGHRCDGTPFAQEMRLTVDPEPGSQHVFVLVRDLSERQRLEAGLAGLADLARLHEGEGSLAVIAARALKLSRRILAADRAAICIFGRDGTVEWLASHRMGGLISAAANLQPSEIPWLRQALDTGQPELIDRRRPGHVRSPLSAAADQLEVAAFAVVPLRTDGELTGLLGATWSADPPDLALDRELLIAVGRLIGLALANARLRDSLLARQQALDESEERYRRLFEEAPEPILLQSADGTVLDANAAACRLFERRLRDLLGQRLEDIASVDRGERTRLRGQLRRRGRGTARGRGLRPDGASFPLLLHVAAAALRGEERLLVQLRDLTEQERLQAELLQAQKMEALGHLISGVAHELNNPLSAIIAFSQLLRSDPRLPQEMAADAELLMQEADRTRRIVQNLLDFASQRPPKRSPVDLPPLVGRTLELQAYALSANSISVDREIPDDLPAVDADAGLIQQVLLNLTLNAIQAIGAARTGGKITISARAVHDDMARRRVRLSIADDGPGISAHVKPHLFEPFFTTKPVGKGTGLGLSVSYGIVGSHGGRLWYEPSSGRGATFVLELPASDEPAQPAFQALGRGQTGSPSTAVARAAARILAIDDERSVGELLTRALHRAGHAVKVAGSGHDALELIADEHFDLLLLDQRMAGMDGTEVYRRALELQPGLTGRAVIMSGDTLDPRLRDFAVANDLRILPKPFDVTSLVTVVEEELSRRR